MWLLLNHPVIASRPCSECEKWCYNDLPGGDHRKTLMMTPRGREPVPRPATNGAATPCGTCPKTEGEEVRARKFAIEINERNQKFFRRWREWHAVGRFPDDLIVERNAATIQGVADAKQDNVNAAFMAVVSMLTEQTKAWNQLNHVGHR